MLVVLAFVAAEARRREIGMFEPAEEIAAPFLVPVDGSAFVENGGNIGGSVVG